ncbi:MAG TPA: tetratricopeptide repeat protein [Anaerolineales bacterium]|nr:tetratricopeptide repeat protein [Anaerolineales bacterium]
MKKKSPRRPNPWRVILLLILIGAALYVNQVIVPATPPLFIPTLTPTRDPESFISEADVLFDNAKYAQAITAYEQAIQVNPDNPSIYLSTARAQIYITQYAQALENAERALILNNNNPLAHTLKAWSLDFLGDYTQAEAAIKSALELDPENALAHAVYAEILMDKANAGQGDINAIDKAAEESRTAMALDPTLMESRRARGYVLWNTGNFVEAIQEYNAALAINDKIADLHLALGYNYYLINEYDQAVQAYLQAYALNPGDPTPAYEISRTYATVGDFSQAVQYADQAVKTNPEDPRMRGNLGVMYYKNNQLPEAIQELGLAIRGGGLEDGLVVEGLPLNYGIVAEFYAIFGLALAKSEQCDEAVAIFQAIRSGVAEDEINVYNAEQGLIICQQGIGETPTEEPTEDIENP